MDIPTTLKQKVVNHQQELKKKIETLEFDTHWFRRVFHTFGAAFLLYYMLPDEPGIAFLKKSLAILLLFIVVIIEYLRIREILDSSQFFGLRIYEQKRPASYLYFGAAMLILLLFFPQQIALPCILCACFADPLIGEFRHRLGKKGAIFLGFFVCLFFFLVTWYKADLWILLSISFVGATAAVIGEVQNFKFIDDDFTIQIFPALIILFLWLGLHSMGINIMPEQIIYPGIIPW